MIVPVLISGMILTSCSTDNMTDEVIFGVWEMTGYAMKEKDITKDDCGTTWHFFQDGALQICAGSRGGIIVGDPYTNGSYAMEAGNLIYRMGEGPYEGPWICKFNKKQNQLQLVRATPVDPGNLMVYISNFMYFKRIN